MLHGPTMLPPSGITLYYTFFESPVLQSPRNSWKLDWFVRHFSGLETRLAKMGDHGVGMVLRGMEQTHRETGDARRGCDHPVLASSDRLYLRQVWWFLPGPQSEQGKKQLDQTGWRDQVTLENTVAYLYPWLPVNARGGGGEEDEHLEITSF